MRGRSARTSASASEDIRGRSPMRRPRWPPRRRIPPPGGCSSAPLPGPAEWTQPPKLRDGPRRASETMRGSCGRRPSPGRSLRRRGGSALTRRSISGRSARGCESTGRAVWRSSGRRWNSSSRSETGPRRNASWSPHVGLGRTRSFLLSWRGFSRWPATTTSAPRNSSRKLSQWRRGSPLSSPLSRGRGLARAAPQERLNA